MERYHIWAEDADTGEIFKCFTWRGTKEAGVRRAWTDARMFERRLSRVWALEAPDAS